MLNIFVLIEHLRGKVADISYMMLAAANELSGHMGGTVTAVLLGGQEDSLTGDLAANKVLLGQHDLLAEFNLETYLQVLSTLLENEKPGLFLFGDTSVGAEVAGELSARLGLPLVSACRQLELGADGLEYTSQICGGKLLAHGNLPANECVLVAMVPGAYKPDGGRGTFPPEVVPIRIPEIDSLSVQFTNYIEPEIADVDITREDVLVAVGRGLQNEADLEMAEELARALGGEVSASRPIVDKGWLPVSRLVGKSGMNVHPRLYLALGISGAPEHAEAITGSELIIAINTDENAPIFNLAHYGAVVDLYDLIPELLDLVQEKALA